MKLKKRAVIAFIVAMVTYGQLNVYASETMSTELTETIESSMETIYEESKYNADGYMIYKSNGYALGSNEILSIIAGCLSEQGDEAGAKYEASLLCNLYERKGVGYANPYEYMKHSKWFASKTRSVVSRQYGIGNNVNGVTITEDLFNDIYDIIVNGNRITLANEHDCFKDIQCIVVNGVQYRDRGNIQNRGNYIQGCTMIINKYGSAYWFEAFPSNSSDPFGIQ